MEGENGDRDTRNNEKQKMPHSSQQETQEHAKKSKPSNTNKTSGAWEHFTKIEVNSEFPRARCNYCGITYACDSQKNGTTNLLKHIRGKCKKYPGRLNDSKQKVLSFGKKESEQDPTLTTTTFNQQTCRDVLAKLVVVLEYPFNTVEYEVFREFTTALQPKFVVPSRSTLTRDCLKLYQKEKKILKSFMSRKGLRVSLTTDTWTSIKNMNYMVLTAHFIDDAWKMQKRILNFVEIEDHKGETIGKKIEECLLEWGMDSVMAMTVDNASSNDVAIKYLRRRLKNWNGYILDGEYLHVRCCAHILNLIVCEALKELHESIVKIRNSVQYVRSSPSRKATFLKCVRAEKIHSKNSPCLDVPTRWNSTYTMLDVAQRFQKVFERLEFEVQQYGIDKTRIPTSDDCENARAFTKFLKLFRDITLRVSASLTVTSHLFFHEVCLVQQQIQEYATSDTSNYFLCDMANKMEAKFNKYWRDRDRTNLLLYVAVVLDPRYKLEFVVFMLNDLYDEYTAKDIGKRVQDLVRKMYDEYKHVHDNEESIAKKTSLQVVEEKKKDDVSETRARCSYLKFAQHLSQKDNQDLKTEFNKYIFEPCEMLGEVDHTLNNFDILAWWKINSTKYKILAKMAKDIFSIQMSTVASESAFSTGGRILDVYRSSLTPVTLQALICTQNWKSLAPIAHSFQVFETTTDHLTAMESEIFGGEEDEETNIHDLSD